MRLFSLIAIFLVSFVVLSSSAQAVEEKYLFDKAHTQILFFVDHLGFSKSQGEFLDYDGYFIFNRDEPEKSYVEVTINTDSIDMDHDGWNEHMKSKDFFDVEDYPTMTFKSTEIAVLAENNANITGDMEILGQTHPVILHTRFNKAGKHPFSGKYVAGFSSYTKLKRSEFGMKYGLPMLGDEVEIRIEVEGIREAILETQEMEPTEEWLP
jgi:polyisoprenoid-binding protein YceI